MYDRKRKSFSERELQVVGMTKPPFPGFPGSVMFDTPISYRENAVSLFLDKRPSFAVTNMDFAELFSDEYNKHLSRGGFGDTELIDSFGVKWTFEPTAGGSISVGGNPKFTDVNDWKNVIEMPDVSTWDWAADAAKNRPDTNQAICMTPVNGFWFERLISFMDFINAAMALVDDEQTDAIHELFEATTALACDVVDKVCEYWPSVDGFMLHDDWGSQREPFFSDSVAREIFLPHMKRLSDHIHSKGRYVGLHSCGAVAARVPVFIDAGIDTWQMQANANNTQKVYEEFGDKIVVQVTCPDFDPSDEKKAVETARWYVDNYCKPGKPTMLLAMGPGPGSQVFAEELYRYSRKAFLNW